MAVDENGNHVTLFYHTWQKVSLCLWCDTWCEHCNQCKCEVRLLPIGQRRYCPNKDMKKKVNK